MVERGIGRGLAAILPATTGDADDETLHRIPLDLIAPNPQPAAHVVRRAGAARARRLAARARCAAARPRTAAARWALRAARRRAPLARRAACRAGRIPAVVRTTGEDERLELALIENMAREDLNPIEAARACAALVDEFGLTKEEVGRRVGKSRVAISNLVRLLELPDEVLSMLESGQLSEGHGRAVLQAPDHHTRAPRRARSTRSRSVRPPDGGPRPRRSRAPAQNVRRACRAPMH